MLYLIGIGLDMKDVSLKALETVKKCSKVYLESYTSGYGNKLKFSELERVFEKKIIFVNRQVVEENDVLIQEAKKQNIALLIKGDPLVATTHVELIMRARKARVKCAVIHAPSVINAISETGLQVYKFGKIASIPKWQENFKPTSFYSILEENQKINAHTLLLLDIGLGVKEAFSYIKKISSEKKDNLARKDFIVCSMLGTAGQKIKIGKISKLEREKHELPACIILPAQLHFAEEEFLKLLR